MNIWAFDLGTKCGWAVSLKRQIKSGTFDFSNGPWDGAGMCYLKFWRTLIDKRNPDEMPKAIFYEAVMSHECDGIYAQHKYGGYLAVLQQFSETYEIPYHGIAVGTIKKFWTGKGNADKKAMVTECRKRGFNPKDDNEADAIAILHYGIKFMEVE